MLLCALLLPYNTCAHPLSIDDAPTHVISVYNEPYSLWDNNVDTKLLKRNTLLLFGSGIAIMGALYLMPSSFTNWEDSDEGIMEKWWNNVSDGPVKDKDDFFLNYITHPYSGALYYMGARSAGANAPYSFLYTFMLSTFFWEYGIEAFAEVPSIQDLIITPVGGAIVGELFYLSKRHILENDRELMGSTALGTTTLFLIDPITEIAQLIWHDDTIEKHNMQFSSYPTLSSHGDMGYQLRLSIAF